MSKIYSITFMLVITILLSACTAASEDSNTTSGTDTNSSSTDLAPTVAHAIPDVNATENGANMTIDLNNTFTDSDNNDSEITKEVLLNTNPTLVNASISSNTLTVDFLQDQYGEANITIRGVSNGKNVETTFEVIVHQVNITSSALHILASSYSKYGTENNTSDDILYIYFDREITEGSIYPIIQDNFNIDGIGYIGSTSTKYYNRAAFSVLTVLFDDNGTQSTAIDTNNSYISIIENTIKDINGNFAASNNSKVKIKDFNHYARLATNRVGAFTLNSNIITDTQTGLKWQKDGNQSGNYSTVTNDCNNIQIDGLSGWRVPSLNELLTIVNRSKINPSIDGTFTNTENFIYYSSTLNEYNQNNAWGIDFSKGIITSMDVNSTNYVRCVHDE